MRWITLTTLLLTVSIAQAQLPAPPTSMADWPMPYAGDFPAVSASFLLDKPAGKGGPIAARDGHFYTGQNRIRFWGVNLAFAANFPPHDRADALAARLATFGINAVRLHHMDNQRFPNGIWSDGNVDQLSDDALDRLDYLVAALKKQGIYCDLNLHVSRDWSKTHHWKNAGQLPEGYDKLLDIFDPDLIAANRQYARDLLTHVNAYTRLRYADEPAICFVEINNEDTLFLWGGDSALARMPEPYATVLQNLWNHWLLDKYKSREKVAASWNVGREPLGDDMLKDAAFDRLNAEGGWTVEQHGAAHMVVRATNTGGHAGAQVQIQSIDGTDWHLQLTQGRVAVKKGRHYAVSFRASAEKPLMIGIGVGQAHAPWQPLGLSRTVHLTTELKDYRFAFIAADDDDNARLSFALGDSVSTLDLQDIHLQTGGTEGLRDDEDPSRHTVRRHDQGIIETDARQRDWYDFLQHTDESYFTAMRDYLKNELGVKCPITGTIGLGPLGTYSQSKMDFVDAHNYWDHPQFPHRAWDMKDWRIKNTPMVDEPEQATLWRLAATRVAGKSFTVTEYQHPSPNEWSADCVPMIASFAALQDWDAVFLFAYSHNADYDKQKISSFFDIEGNPAKMPFMPLAARIFLGRDILGTIAPLQQSQTIVLSRDRMLATAPQYYYTIWPFVHDVSKLTGTDLLRTRLSVSFNEAPVNLRKEVSRAHWEASGPATGQYSVVDDHGIVFVGFPGRSPINLGPLRIESMQTPFVSLLLVPADPRQTIVSADRLLLAVVARTGNTDMKWSADRKTVGMDWGIAPPRIEVVRGELSLNGGGRKIYRINPDGKLGQTIESHLRDQRCMIPLGEIPSVWYEIDRIK